MSQSNSSRYDNFLMLSILGKNFSCHFEIYFLISYFSQKICFALTFHEMSKPAFLWSRGGGRDIKSCFGEKYKKKKITNLSFDELAQRVVKVKG